MFLCVCADFSNLIWFHEELNKLTANHSELSGLWVVQRQPCVQLTTGLIKVQQPPHKPVKHIQKYLKQDVREVFTMLRWLWMSLTYAFVHLCCSWGLRLATGGEKNNNILISDRRNKTDIGCVVLHESSLTLRMVAISNQFHSRFCLWLRIWLSLRFIISASSVSCTQIQKTVIRQCKQRKNLNFKSFAIILFIILFSVTCFLLWKTASVLKLQLTTTSLVRLVQLSTNS